jgi:hypothetical protein
LEHDNGGNESATSSFSMESATSSRDSESGASSGDSESGANTSMRRQTMVSLGTFSLAAARTSSSRTGGREASGQP